jgi:hypothetical protein
MLHLMSGRQSNDNIGDIIVKNCYFMPINVLFLISITTVYLFPLNFHARTLQIFILKAFFRIKASIRPIEWYKYSKFVRGSELS